MKMAMAVGDKRHFMMESIVGRHFVQSAVKAGLGRAIALEVIEDVLETGPEALKRIMAALPKGFPAAVAEPIAEGVRSRLQQLDRSHE